MSVVFKPWRQVGQWQVLVAGRVTQKAGRVNGSAVLHCAPALRVTCPPATAQKAITAVLHGCVGDVPSKLSQPVANRIQ